MEKMTQIFSWKCYYLLTEYIHIYSVILYILCRYNIYIRFLIYSQESVEEVLYLTEGCDSTLRHKEVQGCQILFIEILENQAEDLYYDTLSK